MGVGAGETAGLHAALLASGASVATAESLTAGRVATALTSTPGASAYFRGGVVAYATEAKVSVLGVPSRVVEEYGVVSGECARAMAEAARSLFGATYGVATTGVAGPDRQEDQPAGTVFVAVAGPADTVGTRVEELALTGDRGEITDEAVRAAVRTLAEIVGHTREAPGLR